MEEELVLVTGASGYIATHIVQQLQRAGYRVRGTVRSLKNDIKVKPLRNLCPEAKHPVELIEAELTDVECWTNAVRDCKYVMHVASPVPLKISSDENEVIKPAVEGTLNVLKACRDAKTPVERVIITGSVAAISCGSNIGGEFTEADWTDLKNKDAFPYIKSKTLAERAAWEFIEALPDKEKFDLAVLHPTFVIGPDLCGEITGTMTGIKNMMERKIPLISRFNCPLVDVRDVAEAHIAAMTNPEVIGKRNILYTGTLWFSEMSQIMDREFKDQGYNVPTKIAPYPLVWLAARFDDTTKFLLPSYGKVTKYNNNRMLTVLGIKPRPLEETIIDMCYSMIETGKIKKTTGYKGQPQK